MFNSTNTPTVDDTHLGDIPTSDLLNEINPDLLDYVKFTTPEVYTGLLDLDRNNSNLLPGPDFTAELTEAIQSSTPSAAQPVAPVPTAVPFANPSPFALDQPVQPVSSGSNHAAALTANLAPPLAPTHAHLAPAMVNAIPQPAQDSLQCSNPVLRAVLGHACAISNINPLGPQGALTRPYFPPQARLGASHRSSPRADPRSSAAVAAVAGAAAAAAAAAHAINTQPQYAPFATQHARFPQGPPVVMRPNVPYTQPQIPTVQPTRGTATTNLRPMVQPAPVSAGSLQPQPSQSATATRKRFRAVAAASSVPVSMIQPSLYQNQFPAVPSSLAHPSFVPSYSNEQVAQQFSPDTSANCDPATANPTNTVENVTTLPVQLKLEQKEQATAQLSPSADQTLNMTSEAGSRKAIRAERNRQSAAASRERKKQHIKELERRVETLSRENAMMQLGQLRAVRQRIEQESKIVNQMKELKREVVDRDMQIHKLSRELKNAKIENGEEEEGYSEVPRPKTWDAAEWRMKKRGSRRRV